MILLTRFKMVVDLVSPQRVGVMVASHNEDTVRFTLQQMQKNNIKPEDKVGNHVFWTQMVFVPTGDLLWTTSRHVRQPLLPTGWDRSLWKIVLWDLRSFRSSGLQRVQVRSVRSRQRGAPLPFQVPQTVKGSFCLINHIFPRRAHENKGILEKLEKEKSLLKRELRDRVGILSI